MTDYLCTPEDYRRKLRDIQYSKNPIDSLCYFYSEKPDMSHGGNIFKQQFLPYVQAYLKNRDRCLDIGYGPGAMVAEAAKHFKVSCGMEVHDASSLVGKFLKQNNCYNWLLFNSENGENFVMDLYYDFIYSWTVFMHFGKIDKVKKILNEIYRYLTHDGIAVIYFSRVYRLPEGETYDQYLHSIYKEEKECPPYLEYSNKPLNQINLKIGLKYMIQLCEDIGFRVLGTACSSKIINGKTIYLGQHGIIIKRP